MIKTLRTIWAAIAGEPMDIVPNRFIALRFCEKPEDKEEPQNA